MLNKIKDMFTPRELLRGNYGIEREGLRTDGEGNLSFRPHPESLGDKIKNPYITTDFSESQLEVITPTFENVKEVYNFTKALYDIAAVEIGDEYIWPQSMPCITPDDSKIPVADLDEASRLYREKLLSKYGGKKQLISGIHFNFSFCEGLIKKLHAGSGIPYQDFKNDLYLKVSRNYLRYRWLIIYLLGSTATLHESYISECRCGLSKIAENTFSNDGALSYRNGVCGYKNKVDLFPSYDSVDEHIKSLKSYIDDGVIESHKELYSQIRLKPLDPKDFFNSLENDGICYLEYRSIDVNPFEKGGIALKDIEFLQLFNLFLLIKEESSYRYWQEDSLTNQNLIANHGQRDIFLIRDGEEIAKKEWALEIFDEIINMNKVLNLGKDEIISRMVEKIKDQKLTYAYRIAEKVKKEGYINGHINLAKKYKISAYNNRFKLEGYEDMELSTQILMKEAIKKGVKVEVIDRHDNFIALSNNGKVEYVKQATKTSKDNYVTVLMMENKSVTKRVLKENGIKVPEGDEFNSLEVAKDEAHTYVNKPIVVKPKSTNFGIGISIFKDGGNEEDILKALDIAFEHDNTVLVEEFIKGREYRFLVVDDKVLGILHRVPANVIGDGVKTIRELVEIKNQDPLRGYKYRTPLEKIILDDNAKLFLKQQDKTFDYIPSRDEVVYLRENSNISTGGDSIDFTDSIPEKFKRVAIESAKAMGARVCGVDMMIEDYRDEDTSFGIIEVNFNPAIHIHSYPYEGKERNIGGHILKLLELI
ncbi:bifunctional glutamate--cysteine ligase GshA/glutathione synthetase GshB [Clostridium sp. LP20]|uniref:bifunctional glutamate--cysteine ligase GshA/glutathione synthetase GshB n=1 Tax=Clostridium sp. LP20 TaxID=3418665 RepID=UPI003EE6CFFB